MKVTVVMEKVIHVAYEFHGDEMELDPDNIIEAARLRGKYMRPDYDIVDVRWTEPRRGHADARGTI